MTPNDALEPTQRPVRPRSAFALFCAVCLAAGSLAGAGPARADFVIGLAVPETGRQAARGRALREAAERAVAALNTSGGVLGEKVRLSVADDHCNEAGAISAAGALLAAGAQLTTGHPCERAALAAASRYAQGGTLFIAPATRHPALTEKRAGATIFRLSGREDRQGEAAGHWLANEAKTGRVAIIQDRTAYARAQTAGALTALKERGIATPAIYPIVASEKSYAAVIAGLVQGGTEAVYFAGYPAEALIILEAMRKAGIKAKFLGCDSLAGSEFAAASAARAPDVRILIRPELQPGADGSGPSPLVQPANAAAQSRQETDPAVLRLESAITAWAEAVRRARTAAAAAVAYELQSGVFATALVPSLTFDAKGDARIAGFVPAAWQDGAWKPAPSATVRP